MNTTFIHELAKFLGQTMCQICYRPMEIMDANGTWCKRCHKEFTDGLLDPAKRISLIDLIRKHRKNYEDYKEEPVAKPETPTRPRKSDR